MSREIVASAVLSADQLPLLTLHRYTAERAMPELIAASALVNNPVRLALFHFQGCESCRTGEPCERGAGLINGCHAWRPRAGTGTR